MLWVYFTCFSCTAYFSGLREKNQPNILTHKIYLGISHSDSTHINGLSYILSAPRISFKKRHQRMTGGQNLLFILFLLSIIQLFLLQPPLSQAKWVQILTLIQKLCTFLHEQLLFHPQIPETNQLLQPRAGEIQTDYAQVLLYGRFRRDHNNPKSDPTHDTCHDSLHPVVLVDIPLRLWAHCSPSQPWFKGSQVMKSPPHHLTICFPQIAPFKVRNSQKKMKLAPLNSSWKFKSLSLLQTALKWRIPGAKLGSRNGAPEGHMGKGPRLKHRVQRACARHSK